MLPTVRIGPKYVRVRPAELDAWLRTRGEGRLASGLSQGYIGPVAMTGAAFRRLRQRLGLTQSGLAARMGVHWNAVARWERGERPISELVARFARLLVATAGNRKPKVGRR